MKIPAANAPGDEKQEWTRRQRSVGGKLKSLEDFCGQDLIAVRARSFFKRAAMVSGAFPLQCNGASLLRIGNFDCQWEYYKGVVNGAIPFPIGQSARIFRQKQENQSRQEV